MQDFVRDLIQSHVPPCHHHEIFGADWIYLPSSLQDLANYSCTDVPCIRLGELSLAFKKLTGTFNRGDMKR